MSRHIDGHYNVRPRYTPGSPALVPYDIARRVATEERLAREHDLSGVHGEDLLARAERLGLGRIVYFTLEQRGGVTVTDLLTSEQYRREGRYREGESVQVWDDDRGWVDHVVAKRYTDSAARVCVRPLDVEPWRVSPVEVARDLVRLTNTVRVLAPEELAGVL
jgi:hypothetical protein